jgi:hypothetical protein
MEWIFRKGRIIMKEHICKLLNGLRVEIETEETGGARYLNVYSSHNTDTDKEPLYCVSIDDWRDSKINKVVYAIARRTAEEVRAAFVYDDISECGIEDALYATKRHKIGWVKKENGDYIHSLKELCEWVLSSRFFEEVPSTIIESVDIEEFGIHLLEGDTIFLFDNEKHRVRTHTGQYYIHNNLILYHLGM